MSRNPGTPAARLARLDRMRRYLAEGRTVSWIALAEGISRERASRLLGRPYRETAREMLPLAQARRIRVIKLAERLPDCPEITTMDAFARAARCCTTTARKILRETGLRDDVVATLAPRHKAQARARHRERSRERLLVWGEAAAARLGRTFTDQDLYEAGISYARVKRAFGSLVDFQCACGLVPNTRWKRKSA